MDENNIAQIKDKCKQIIEKHDFKNSIKNIFEESEYKEKYPCFDVGILAKAKWAHANTGEIIFNSDVSVNDEDFERSLCHEIFHDEFSNKAEYKEIVNSKKNNLDPYILSLRVLSEVYVEKKVAQLLQGLPINKKLMDCIGSNSVMNTLRENYLLYKVDLSENNKLDILIYLLFFPINTLSYHFEQSGAMLEPFRIGKINALNSLDLYFVKLLCFFRWLQKNVIPVKSEKLLNSNLIEKTTKQIYELFK